MTYEPLIVIGYDPREREAYEVCKFSIQKYLSKPITIVPLIRKTLEDKGIYQRTFSRKAVYESNGASSTICIDTVDGKPFSTEFSFSRFFLPRIIDKDRYRYVLFCDCDFLFTNDLSFLFDYYSDLFHNKFAIACVQHNQKINSSVKMDGQVQELYFRKNWSSFVLWDLHHKAHDNLTIEKLNKQSGSWLHSFGWIEDENDIQPIPHTYNWIKSKAEWFMVSEQRGLSKNPIGIHYTEGGPWFAKYQNCDFSNEWKQMKLLMNNNTVTSLKEVMKLS